MMRHLLMFSLSKEAFDTNRGLWLSTNQNELYPNPHSYATEGKSGQSRSCRMMTDDASSAPAKLVWFCTYSRSAPSNQVKADPQIGRMLGKALYDGILVDVSFASFFRER